MVEEPEAYVPERDDIVYLDFTEDALGHEEMGKRPALVLTIQEFNEKLGLARVCPITRQDKGLPFEIVVPSGLKISGVVLVDQVRSVDWRGRRAGFVQQAPEEFVVQVLHYVRSFVD